MGTKYIPPAPIFDHATFGDPRVRHPLTPFPPLPWIYRDPQSWLMPMLAIIAVIVAGFAFS